MVERIGFASGVLLILVLMCTTPCTHAQTFLKPTLDFPGYMDVGTTLSITCTCYSNGMTTTIVMARSDSENVDATTSCNLIGGNTYACVAEYTFTVKLADIDVSLSCTAVPSDGSTPKSADPGVFNQVRVRLTEKPVISGPDSVKAGENNTWTCTSQPVRPAGTLRWRIGETESYSDGTTPTSTQSGQVFVTTTSISRIFASSDGTFNIHCDATHETRDDKLTETKAVQVQYPPVVTSTTTTYTPLEGLTQVLSCFIDAVPPPTDVSWLKDNQPLDRSSGKYSNGNSFNNADLTIANIQKEDSGVFVCTATNDVSTSASTGPNVTVTVRYAPRVSTPESSYSADRYTSLVIPCVIDANPSATNVTWKRTRNGVTEDLLIASSGGKYNGGSISTPALSINNLALEDGADYQCFVSNGINPDAQSQVVTVMINYPPTDISVSPISPVVNETDSVTVTCNADGIPTPTYSWYYESNPQVIASSQNLVITSATSSDSGKYQCVASNTKGNASITVVVSVWFKPRLTPSSSPQVADEGSTLTLDCNISSNPTPFTVAWQDSQGNLVDRSSGRISGGTSSAIPHLTFTGIQIADAGLYRCRVDNVVGVTISSFVEVKVSYPPRNMQVTPANSVHNLDEGDALTLTCNAEAEPPATYTWKSGSDVIGTGSSLVISSAGPVDNRNVTCEATNSKATVTKSTTIYVSYTPVVTIPGGDAFGVDEGQSLVLPCLVDANPADTTFNWLRDSTAVDLTDTSKYGGGMLTSRNLTIFSLASSDAGNYSCQSVNSVGTGTSREVIVTISYKPQNIEVDPRTVTVTEGGEFVVTCSANGVPSPTFKWLKGGVTIQDGDVLNVTSAEINDAGLYTCQSTNAKGSINVSMVVTVQYTPRITSPDTSLTSEDGANVTIQCDITANPNITSVTWRMVSGSVVKTLNMSDSDKYDGGTVSKPSLTIKNPDDSDAGQYQCNATNSIGTGSGPFVTVVLSSAPKTISFSPTTVSANEGQTIQVTCSSDGTPTPNYTWLRGGTEYSSGATLQIDSATIEDNANFTCRATNSKGTKESVISISVLYVPRSSNTNNVYQTTIGTTVTLTCPVIANPPATSYTWSYGGASLNETGPSIDVTPADAASFGEYTCTATNSVGTSGGIVVNLQRTTIPGTGESTAAAGLSTPILILIILLIILLIIVIIVIVAICIKKGKCKKKDPKGRVGPVIAANAAGTEASPRPTEKPLTEAHSGVRTPQWSAVSRKDVDVTMNGHTNKEHDKLSIEDESRGGAPVPNGIPGTEPVAGGTIISLPDGNSPRPHHLPPVEATPEKKKRRKRKKKHREETGEKPIDGPIDEEEEEEEE